MDAKPANAGEKEPARPWWRLSLTTQIVIGLIAGVIGGYAVNVAYGDNHVAREAFLKWPGLLKDIFLNLIRSMVAPLVFSSLVAGIAGHEDMKKVGRIGLKSSSTSRSSARWRSSSDSSSSTSSSPARV